MGAQLNIDIVYLFLNLILFVVFRFQGRNISINEERYKSYALYACVAFTLISGSRYMRGNDYGHYVEVFNHGFGDSHYTPIFTAFNDLLKYLGFSAYSAYYFYALVFIVCSFVFLSRFKKYANYTIPLFLVSMLVFNEYQIRQALGFSFVFIFLHYLFNIDLSGSKIHLVFKVNTLEVVICFICFIITLGIHKANVLYLCLFAIFYIFIKKRIHYCISIPLVFLSSYFLGTFFDYSLLTPLLNIIAGEDEIMQGYVDNSHVWFSAEGGNDLYDRNPIVKVMECIGYSAIYYYGYKAIDFFEHRQIGITIFNLFVCGSLFMITFRRIELMNRMGANLNNFWFFVMAIILYYRQYLFTSSVKRIFSIFLFFFYYAYLKYLFFPAIDKTKFLWDL